MQNVHIFFFLFNICCPSPSPSPFFAVSRFSLNRNLLPPTHFFAASQPTNLILGTSCTTGKCRRCYAACSMAWKRRCPPCTKRKYTLCFLTIVYHPLEMPLPKSIPNRIPYIPMGIPVFQKKLFCWLHLLINMQPVRSLFASFSYAVCECCFFIFIIFVIFLASFDDVDQSCQQEVFGLQEAIVETLAQAFIIILYICIYSRPYR